MNTTFSIRQSFSFAWGVFAKRPWFFIVVVIAIGIVMALSSAIFSPRDGGNILFRLVNLVIGIFVDMGLVTLALHAHDNVAGVSWKTLWAPARFWQYLGAAILTGIIVVIGLILLIIPGIIAALGLMFTKYLVLDRKLGPVQALKESWRITKGSRLRLLGFLIVAILINIAGAIALGIGLLVTVPLTMLATVHIYRLLEAAAPRIVTA